MRTGRCLFCDNDIFAGKPHGTHIFVPYKSAENTASSRNIATNKSLRGRGGVCPARGFMVITTLRVNRPKGFPLWGKLSPKVTDEGATAGHLPLIRRVPRHLPPKGKAFVAPPATQYYNEYNGLACRHGYYAARCSRPDITI